MFSLRSRRWAMAVWALIVVAGATLATCPAMADQYFNTGVTYFNQKQYQKALPYFEYALRNSPWDSNAYYYLALTYHYMGDTARAKQMYRQVIERFGAQPAAAMAATALKKIDPNYQLPQGMPGVSSAGRPSAPYVPAGSGDAVSSADLASLPNEARIYYTPVGNSMRVDAQLNGRGMSMVFDTGAENCVFGKNHLQQAGISPPTGKADGLASGVGSSKPIQTWKMKVDLKVGPIIRKNFPITVQDELGVEPLLGQSFFKDFQYTVDTGAHSIQFTKRAAASAGGASFGSGRDNYAVPFTREGNEMVVDVEVNGRSCKMYFDTGAEGTIAFAKNQLGRVGLTVPEDAEDEIHKGIGGETKGHAFVVQRVKLGPVDKRDVRVSVLDDATTAKPLLGHGFFGDWQFTIDNQARLIRFVRR